MRPEILATYARLAGLSDLGRGPAQRSSRVTQRERTRTTDRQALYSREAMHHCRRDIEDHLQLKVKGSARCGMQGCVWKVAPAMRGLRPQVLKLSMQQMAYSDASAALWLRLHSDEELLPERKKIDPSAPSFPTALPRLKRVGVGVLRDCLPENFKGAPAFLTLREDLASLPMRGGMRKMVRLLDMMQTFVLDRRRGSPSDFLDRYASEIERLPPAALRAFGDLAELQEWLYARGLFMCDLGSADGSNLGYRRWTREVVARDIGMLCPIGGRRRGDVLGARERSLVRRAFEKRTAQAYAPVLAGFAW